MTIDLDRRNLLYKEDSEMLSSSGKQYAGAGRESKYCRVNNSVSFPAYDSVDAGLFSAFLRTLGLEVGVPDRGLFSLALLASVLRGGAVGPANRILCRRLIPGTFVGPLCRLVTLPLLCRLRLRLLNAMSLVSDAKLAGSRGIGAISTELLPRARLYESKAARWASRSATVGSMDSRSWTGFRVMELVDLLRLKGRRCLFLELLRRSIAYHPFVVRTLGSISK